MPLINTQLQLGAWRLDISRRPLPKGELRIARQFTAGFESEIAQVPEGRLNLFMSYVIKGGSSKWVHHSFPDQSLFA